MDARELVAPDITDENFKWKFAVENMKPRLDIQGPSVGSLLYAMNPMTSELGLKQMDSELNQQLNANENFDKRGDRALKFMEDRVQEDINRKKMQNVDAGHANSLLSNYTQAIQSGDATAIAMAEDQIRRTFPNADAIMNQAKQQAEKGKIQKQKYFDLDSELPRGNGWINEKELENWKKKVDSEFWQGNIDDKSRSELIKAANSIGDRETKRLNAIRTAHDSAAAQRSVDNEGVDIMKAAYDIWKAEREKNGLPTDYRTFEMLFNKGKIKK